MVEFTHYFGHMRAYTLWNSNHPLRRQVTPEALAWEKAELSLLDSDAFRHREVLLGDPHRAAAWILAFVTSDLRDQWTELCAKEPKLVRAVWRRVFGRGETAFYVWRQTWHVYAQMWSPEGVAGDEPHPDHPELPFNPLPTPAVEWWIVPRESPPQGPARRGRRRRRRAPASSA
jgi:hypothetical protein